MGKKQEINHGYCNVCGIETQPVMKCQCDFRKKPQDLKEQLIEEFESLKCVNYAMYFGCVGKICDCGETRCANRQTVEMAEKEYKDWLRTAFARLEEAVHNHSTQQ